MSWIIRMKPEDYALQSQYRDEAADLTAIKKRTAYVDETQSDPQADECSWLYGPTVTHQAKPWIEGVDSPFNVPAFIIGGKAAARPHKAPRIPWSKSERNIILGSFDNRCVECGAARALEIHHLDGNRANNAIENLTVLCRACHLDQHHVVKEVVDNE